MRCRRASSCSMRSCVAIYANVAAQDLLGVQPEPGARPPVRRLSCTTRTGSSSILRRALDDRRGHCGSRAHGAARRRAARAARARCHHHAARRPAHRHASAARARRRHAAAAHLARERSARAPRRQPADDSAARARDQESARRPARRGAAARARAAEASLQEYTGVIISEADRLTALVDSMAGPSAPAAESSRSTCTSSASTCTTCCAPKRRRACGRARLRSEPAGRACSIGNQIIQALLNVARNALQALGERGRIVLRTRALSNVSIGSARHRLVASVQVEDNGPGVPPDLRSSIFYPLVTGRANGTRPGARGRAGPRDPPRRPHRVRERAGTHRFHLAAAARGCAHERRSRCASGSSTTMPPSAGCSSARCATAAWRRARSKPPSRRWPRCAANRRTC